jgi:hypothetical protein
MHEGGCMAKTENDIIEYTKHYIDACGGDYPAWYAGIAANPRDRLIKDHRVNIDNDLWIFSTAKNAEAARSIEQYFVETLGTDGGTGGGDENTRSVYAYKKSTHTEPQLFQPPPTLSILA